MAALEKIITGNPLEQTDQPVAPYRTGYDIETFFDGFEVDGPVGTFSTSRWAVAQAWIRHLTQLGRLGDVVAEALNPGAFRGSDYTVDDAAAFLDPYLRDDGHQLVRRSGRHRLAPLQTGLVELGVTLSPGEHVTHEFIEEQIAKCEHKLADGDFDGAITNARSLVEATLADIESRLVPLPEPHKGDLVQLYKRVQKLLNLEQGRKDIADGPRKILQGLASVVSGIAPMRNKMSDAHARVAKPAPHHARLAVNAARTLVNFAYDSFEFQLRAGRITEVNAKRAAQE